MYGNEFDDPLIMMIKASTQAIAMSLKSQRGEESHPRFGADESDQFIEDKKAKVAKLREIREQLEELFASE